MAWTNSGYESQTTDAARLTMARAFKGEIMAAITADVSADGKSRSSQSLNALLAAVTADIREYESRVPGSSRSAAINVADFRNGV